MGAEKLYVVVRADMEAGFQMAQGIHAKDEYQSAYPLEHALWRNTSNTISVLTVENEAALDELVFRAEAFNIPVASFREPDIQHALTAACFHPTANLMLRKLPIR